MVRKQVFIKNSMDNINSKQDIFFKLNAEITKFLHGIRTHHVKKYQRCKENFTSLMILTKRIQRMIFNTKILIVLVSSETIFL